MKNANQIITALQNDNSNINLETITDALKNVASTTFATLTQASKISTAAKHNNQALYKITRQNVILNNGESSLYENKVKRDVQEAFKAIASHYEAVNGSYSVCALKSDTNKHYLRAIVNKALEVIYYDFINDQIVDKEFIAQYLAPAAAKKLLAPKKPTFIKHANIELTENIIIRNFSLKNIYSININKKSLIC